MSLVSHTEAAKDAATVTVAGSVTAFAWVSEFNGILTAISLLLVILLTASRLWHHWKPRPGRADDDADE